jgi:tRNA pseudouridine13 synthase
VTAENIADFTMYDIVLPIVGPSVRLPQHEGMAQIMLDILNEDKITLQMFADQDGVQATSASGDYRKILTKPDDVQFDVVKMQNENEDLLTPNYLTEKDPTPVIDEAQPCSKALRLRFNLRSSSYATMFLREVTRTTSSFEF